MKVLHLDTNHPLLIDQLQGRMILLKQIFLEIRMAELFESV